MKKQILLFTIIAFLVSCSQKIKQEDAQTNSDSTKTSVTTVENKIPGQSEITCPKCGFKKTETMPTDVCLLKYTCQGCRAELLPKEGDCCVFCTYGTEKCPSKQ